MADASKYLSGECTRNKIYSVKWSNIEDRDYVHSDGCLSLAASFHSDSPMLSTEEVYVGPLCEHELAFLKSLPGIDYSLFWRFDVEEIGTLEFVSNKS